MATPSDPSHTHHEKFSLSLFALTIAATVTGLLGLLRLVAPGVWEAQLLAPLWKGVVVFLVVHMTTCFIEYFFHRYVLHAAPISFLRRLHRQHHLHHGLTRIGQRRGRDGRHVLFIENRYPIVEPEQGEASFFPWYSLAVFSVVLTPFLALAHWVLPAFPWFLVGYITLAIGLSLYELIHAVEHWAFETWEPLIAHPRWGGFWRKVYGFHLRHHAVIDCNESVSGFFGMPVADWVFGTCVIPRTIYADGESWDPEKFSSPRPRWPIRWLDARLAALIQRRRERAIAAAAMPVPEKPVTAVAGGSRLYTRGEQIANWVTHGIGFAFSIVALTLLIVFSSVRGDAWHVVSFTVFGISLLALYAISTIYHAHPRERVKLVLQRLDHAAIFILIAGTYTPFLLTHLRGPWGWTLFGIVWGLCGAGAVFQLVFGQRYRPATITACVFLGWLIIAAIKPLAQTVPHTGLWLLLAGGLCYTTGVIFYLWRQLRYHHAVWHTFVLGGSTCHFLAVLLFLLPQRM